MHDSIREPWLVHGYRLFAKEGPTGLKIEVLSRQVGKNKSSFYHHFADLEVFIVLLLERHLKRAQEIAIEERKCQNLDPELIDVILDFKEDLLFNRQLRVHRQRLEFEACCRRSNQIVGEALAEVWAKSLGLTQEKPLSGQLLQLVMENFYLQITEDKLNRSWLAQYFTGVQQTLGAYGKQGANSSASFRMSDGGQ